LSWFESQGTQQSNTGSGDSLKRGYQNVIRKVKEQPMPALSIGAGITWMILGSDNDDTVVDPRRTGESEPISDERSEKSGIAAVVKEKVGQVQETFSGATAAVTDKMADVASGVQEGVRSARSTISDGLRRGQRASSNAAQHLQKGSRYTGDRFQEAVEEYPVAVAVGFLGVGLLTGLLLPRTPQEDKLIGAKSDRLIEQVKETGKETLEKAKTVVQRVAQSTMDEAKRQGIAPESVGDKFSEIKDKVGAVATQAKNEAVRAADEERLKH
jgi:ElaB/YqjD/DUF883 family membrane-anchored ribosome-binding protein